MNPTMHDVTDKVTSSRALEAEEPKIFSRLGQELKTDVQTLLQQHIAIIKAESKPSMVKVAAGLFTICLAVLMVGFSLLRAVDAVAFSLGNAWDWTSDLRPLLSGIILLLVAIILALISRQLFLKARGGLAVILNEIKEDFQWLKKIL